MTAIVPPHCSKYWLDVLKQQDNMDNIPFESVYHNRFVSYMSGEKNYGGYTVPPIVCLGPTLVQHKLMSTAFLRCIRD